MTIELIKADELRLVAGGPGKQGRVGVIYQVQPTGEMYLWDGRKHAPVSGDALGAGHDQAFVIGGQSNADGRGVIDANAEAPNPACKLYTKGGKIEVCAEPAGKQDPGWINNIPSGVTPGAPAHSFATSAAKEILRLTGVRPLMVPCAIGSTNMTQWAPPAVERNPSTLFGQLHARAEAAMVGGRSPVFLWSGHEAGATGVTENLATGVITITSGYATDWRLLMQSLRNRFANCPIIYVQLGADAGANSTAQRRAAEIHRLAEGTFGDSTTLAAYEPVAEPPWAYLPLGATGANTAQFTGPGSVALVGDGTTLLGANLLQGLTAGASYRIGYSWVGSGEVKLSTSVADSAFISPGTGTRTIAVGSNGLLGGVRRNPGSVINGSFTITSVELALPLSVTDSVMVVQHDLPRNPAPDDQHLSDEGHRMLGRRIAAAYAERVLKMPGINGTGPRLVSCTKSGADVLVKFNRVIQPSATGYGASLATSLFRVYVNGTEQTLTACARDGSDTTAVRITCAASVASGTCVVTYGDRAGPGTTIMRPGCVYDTDGLPAPMMGTIVAV